MRIDDLNEAPMGILNRMAQKVVSKVPGGIGAKAQGKLETGQVANQWKKDYMKFLGRTGQKPDTENLKAFLKTLGMTDQDTVAIVGESALIERALTGTEIDKIILKAAQKGGGEAMGAKGAASSSADSSPDAGSRDDTTAPASQTAAPAASGAAKPTLAQRAGQAVKGLASRAASAIGQKLVPNAGGAATAQAGQRIEPTVGGGSAAKQAAGAPAKAQPSGVAAPVGAKSAGAGIDTYINNWAKNINAAATPQEKVNLAKEVINFLKDRKGSPEGQRGAAMAKSVLKRSKDPTLQKMAQSGAFALERKIYAVANKLLEAVGLTWKDLGYRIAVTESTSDYIVIVER